MIDDCLYLAVVIDLFSWQVVGWSMRPALHTDQGCQFTSGDWQRFPKGHKMGCGM